MIFFIRCVLWATLGFALAAGGIGPTTNTLLWLAIVFNVILQEIMAVYDR